MSLVVNALIGFANLSTVALSGLNKVPQVYSLIKSKSPEGVSLQSILLELSGYLIVMSYNFYSKYPLASYFEYPLLVIQDIVMLLVMLNLLNLYSTSLIIPVTALLALTVGIAWGHLPHSVINILLNLCIPLSASSKVVQLRKILVQKDSKGVSVTAWLISSYTSLTRLFTIYVETFDVPLLLNFFVSLLLNLAVVAATLFYAPSPQKKKDKTKTKKKK